MPVLEWRWDKLRLSVQCSLWFSCVKSEDMREYWVYKVGTGILNLLSGTESLGMLSKLNLVDYMQDY